MENNSKEKPIAEDEKPPLTILDLTPCVLMTIFEYLPYDTIAKNRIVCHGFNIIGGLVLNSGYNRVIKRHMNATKLIKSQLPRRESERRVHHLSRHSDVLSAIETRISMLTLAFTKYIDQKLCCFIPGHILDELNRVLSLVEKRDQTLGPHEMLQELRDISSMAIEHFEEVILPDLKAKSDNSKKDSPFKFSYDNAKYCGGQRYNNFNESTKDLIQRLFFNEHKDSQISGELPFSPDNLNNNHSYETDREMSELKDKILTLEKRNNQLEKRLKRIHTFNKKRTSRLCHRVTYLEKHARKTGGGNKSTGQSSSDSNSEEQNDNLQVNLSNGTLPTARKGLKRTHGTRMQKNAQHE